MIPVNQNITSEAKQPQLGTKHSPYTSNIQPCSIPYKRNTNGATRIASPFFHFIMHIHQHGECKSHDLHLAFPDFGCNVPNNYSTIILSTRFRTALHITPHLPRPMYYHHTIYCNHQHIASRPSGPLPATATHQQALSSLQLISRSLSGPQHPSDRALLGCRKHGSGRTVRHDGWGPSCRTGLEVLFYQLLNIL